MRDVVTTDLIEVACPNCGVSIRICIDTTFDAETMEGRFLPRYRHECPDVTRIKNEVDAAVVNATDARMTR